jgi:DNA-binding MltR family transcriptional regulator
MSENESNERGEYDPFWMTGKDLERHFSLEDAQLEFSRLFRFEGTNDRALAVVGVSFLEMMLEHILINFLVSDDKEVAELLRYDQPLGTYSGRVRIAYCLGLLRKPIFHDLKLVGRIRNKFAHDLYASFEDEQISSWCKALKWHRQAYMNPPGDATARELFHVGLNQLVCHLSGVVSIARGEKRTLPAGD